ncbi:MAG: hypothetical protein ACP5IA_06540 [Sediminispirochaetaceae bacterium]
MGKWKKFGALKYNPTRWLVIYMTIMVITGAVSLQALEMETYGSLELDSGIAGSGGTASAAAEGLIDANHRLSLSEAEFYIHHEAEAGYDSEVEYTIHEAYLVLFRDWGNLTFGRQRIPWGTGIFFSPTDALHPVSLTGEAETGFDGLSGTVLLPADITVAAAVSLSPALDYAEAAADPAAEELGERVRGALSVSGYAGTLDWRTTMVYQWQRVFRPGISLSADLSGFIISLEGALELHNSLDYIPGTETPELWDPYPLAGVGIEKSWFGMSDTFTIIAEYLFDGRGYTEEQAAAFFSLPPGLEDFADSPALGRHYLNASIEYNHDEKIRTEHGVLLNLQDASGTVFHGITYAVGSGVDFRLEGSWSFGDEERSEFGLYSQLAVQDDGIPDELAEYAVSASVEIHF